MELRTIDGHIDHIKDVVKNYGGWTEDELEKIAYRLVEEGYINFGNSYVVVKALEESFEDYYPNYYPIRVIISFMDEIIRNNRKNKIKINIYK